MLKERWLSRRTGESLRILFSQQDGWESMIRSGFDHTLHQVFFGEFDQEALSTFDLVVPLSISDVLSLRGLAQQASRNLLPIPDDDVVLLCHDKPRLNHRLIDLGFGENIPEMQTVPSPPFILKKRLAENSDGCHLVMNQQDRERLAPFIESNDYFCQAIVADRSEYASHVLYDDRRIVAEITVVYRADRNAFIKGQEEFITKDLIACPAPTLFGDMLQAIGFRGLCCLNYKLVDGRVQLLEINPRFGGSLSPLFFAVVRHMSELPRGAA